jgi:transposase
MTALRPVTDTELDALSYDRFGDFSPLVSKRLHAIYHVAFGRFKRAEIADFLGLTHDTILEYVILFNEQGIPGLKTVKTGQHNVSDLESFVSVIIPDFELIPPKTSGEACQRIRELTDISRSPTQVRAFMKRHGLRYLKAGQIPAKADSEKQKEFVEQTLNPLITRAENEEIHLLFMDSVHPVMGVFLCSLWSAVRIFIKSSAGRKRLNMLAAVNAITQEINLFTNEDYINAEVIVKFLYQIRIYYFDMKPIHIILDNARYQHCDLVRYTAWTLGIKLVFLPPYSPNLNVIERLWKWMKKKTLYAQYYKDFASFKSALIDTIQTAKQKHPDELKTLLNLKFQTF